MRLKSGMGEERGTASCQGAEAVQEKKKKKKNWVACRVLLTLGWQARALQLLRLQQHKVRFWLPATRGKALFFSFSLKLVCISTTSLIVPSHPIDTARLLLLRFSCLHSSLSSRHPSIYRHLPSWPPLNQVTQQKNLGDSSPQTDRMGKPKQPRATGFSRSRSALLASDSPSIELTTYSHQHCRRRLALFFDSLFRHDFMLHNRMIVDSNTFSHVSHHFQAGEPLNRSRRKRGCCCWYCLLFHQLIAPVY